MYSRILIKRIWLTGRKRAKNRRKKNARTPWKRIHRRVLEVALTAFVNP
jgi:hypothetical protein